ncbi:MAG TPA: hypothetical protein VI072_18610 [Polyangiaceae bacterium]
MPAVSVALLATSEGGRATSVGMQGARWRPHLRVPASPELLGVVFTFGGGPEEVEPGSQCEAVAVLVYTSTGVDYSVLQPGVTAEIVEGTHVVGTARVVDLLGT